jgi:hypothetical protein
MSAPRASRRGFFGLVPVLGSLVRGRAAPTAPPAPIAPPAPLHPLLPPAPLVRAVDIEHWWIEDDDPDRFAFLLIEKMREAEERMKRKGAA